MTDFTLPRPVAVYDASVLSPSLIRNLLMHLGTEGLVAARWSRQIHEEWTRNLLQDRPDLTPERLARTRQQMQLALPDAEIEGFEQLIATLSLPDPDDRHVLAAAVQAGAELIVTQNLKHFPAEALSLHGIEALTLDALLCRLLEEWRPHGRPFTTKTQNPPLLAWQWKSCGRASGSRPTTRRSD